VIFGSVNTNEITVIRKGSKKPKGRFGVEKRILKLHEDLDNHKQFIILLDEVTGLANQSYKNMYDFAVLGRPIDLDKLGLVMNLENELSANIIEKKNKLYDLVGLLSSNIRESFHLEKNYYWLNVTINEGYTRDKGLFRFDNNHYLDVLSDYKELFDTHISETSTKAKQELYKLEKELESLVN
jgi:hypothetical protein